MDKRSLSELSWQLVPVYQGLIEKRQPKDLLKKDRFTVPSGVSQRTFAAVERVFFDHFSDLEFVELSPLQAIGINKVLGDVNGKKVIPTIRGQEVNADATTALFLEAYKRKVPEIRLATHARTTRAKIFDPKSKFLPHFKVFAEVSLGVNGSPFGRNEVMALIRHLQDEISVLKQIQKTLPNNIAHFNIYISNLCFVRELVERQGPIVANTNTVEMGSKILESANLPRLLPVNENLVETIRSLGFSKGLRILQMFVDNVMPLNFGGEKLVFDLSRSAGANYYRHLAYKITATSQAGDVLPLADGGTNDWVMKMNSNKQAYAVTSGIGTELLAQNFITPTSF